MSAEYTGFESGGYDADSNTPNNNTYTFEHTRQTIVKASIVGNRDIDILNDANDATPQIPQNKDSKNGLSNIIGSMKIEMSKPNTQLTDTHVNAAHMARSARINLDDGQEAAQKYLNDNEINKTIVESNRYGIMVRDNETGNYTLALRGMNPTDPRDIFNASQQTAGLNESRSMGQKMIDNVKEINGSIERIVGFSMGGGDAFDLARSNGIDGTLLDPAINPRHVWENTTSLSSPRSEIEIVRNPENFISVGTSMRNVSLKPQYKVSVVPTGKSGVLANHELLPNFTRQQQTDANAVAQRLARVGSEHAQHITLIDMKESMNNGQSFTEFYRQLNSRNGQASGVDVDVDGVLNKLGSRVNEGSPLVKLWKQLNGGFTESEQQHLSTAGSSSTQEALVYDEDVLNMIKTGNLQEAKLKSNKSFQEAIESMNNNEVYAHPAMKSAFGEHLQNATSPTGLMTGGIASLAGAGAMSLIDPSGTFGRGDETGRVENQAVGGGITGLFADVLNQGLAGSGSVVSAGVGGIVASAAVGAVAAEGTRYGVDKALKRSGANSDTRNSVSSLSGGFVGGAATVAAADAITIGVAAATGAEVGALAGPLGVAVGAGVGAVFGTMAYAVSKINQIPQVQKEETKIENSIKKEVKSVGKEIKSVGKSLKHFFHF